MKEPRKWEETYKENKLRRISKLLNCLICPIGKGENATRYPKHGKTKPRYKDKRGERHV